MNGFTNGIMSMLLGWLRLLISNLWKLLTSPDGSMLYRFMKDNWIAILAVLLVGGLVVDRVVYFLRWRPDYIWASRRAARRGMRAARRGDSPRDSEAAEDIAPAAAEAGEYTPPQIGYAPTASAYAPPVDATRKAYAYAPPAARSTGEASSTQTFAPAAAGYAPIAGAVNPTQTYAPHAASGAAPTGAFAPPAKAVIDGEASGSRISVQKPSVQPIYTARGNAPSTGYAEATARFAPMASVRGRVAPMRNISLPADLPEPVFDDDPPEWISSPKRDGKMTLNPAKGMVNNFGNAMPEPAEYLRDMQAGFAPQLPPERIFPTAPAPRAEDAVKQPVHPGLGSDAFRQSFGLDDAEPLSASAPAPRRVFVPPEAPPEFKPYAQALDEQKQPSGRRPNPFAAIAKKARDLVGVEDDSHKLTIRDLQPTVDMRTAFRDPVYPRPKPGDEA